MIFDNTVVIDNVIINYTNGITEDEVRQILAEERLIWLAKDKTLGRLELTIFESDEIVVTAHERSPIKRLRRITGYLSEVDKFNDAKQAELADRKAQL